MSELSEDQLDIENYFKDKKLKRENFQEYVDSKKEIVKSNYRTASQNILGSKELDFNSILGCLISEKYESMVIDSFLFARELKINYLDLMSDVYWICASPEICSLFEVGEGFNPTGFEYKNSLNYTGSIQFLENPIHILKTELDPKYDFFIGYGNNCYKITLLNFVI